MHAQRCDSTVPVTCVPHPSASLRDHNRRPALTWNALWYLAVTSWQVRAALAAEGAAMLVVTALDDVAWLLNIRGSDVEYNPVWCVRS